MFKIVDQNNGLYEIQYRQENVCIHSFGNEDALCAANPPNGSKWSPRLASIKTAQSTIPNYEFNYRNLGDLGAEGMNAYWNLHTKEGQITKATLNFSEVKYYAGPSMHPGWIMRESGDISVRSARFELGVIETVISKQQGTFVYHKDLRRFVEKYYPIHGQGPNKHFYYEGPRGNLSKVNAILNGHNEITLFEAGYSVACVHPKTCNQPLWVKDAKGNITEYEYDALGRFGAPVKVTMPADENGVRPTTIYHYEPLHAYYKRTGESISQDPDPVWTLTREHTCRTTTATSNGCVGGEVDMIKTEYFYGQQSVVHANNLLLKGKSVTAEGSVDGTVRTIETRVICYEYDKYGNLIGETAPKGNGNDLQSCQ